MENNNRKPGRPKGGIPWNKGLKGVYKLWPNGRKPFSEETKKKISDSSKGREPWNKGKPHLKIRGSKNPNWKGGLTSHDQILRSRVEFKNWKKDVFICNSHICFMCKSKEQLIAHHKKDFKNNRKLRYAVNNGVIVCRACHLKIHKPKRKYV